MSTTEPTLDTFGARLAMLREEAGLSQSALARRMKTSQSAVSQIESGARNPTLGTLYDLATSLKISVPWLLDEGLDLISVVERKHLLKYRGLTRRQQQHIEEYIQFLVMKNVGVIPSPAEA